MPVNLVAGRSEPYSEPVTDFHDDFIGPEVSDLANHIPASFEDFQNPTQAHRWTKQAASTMGIVDNRPTNTEAPEFKCTLNLPTGTAWYIVDKKAPVNFRYAIRVYNAQAKNYEVSFNSTANANDGILLRFQGGALKLLDVSGGAVNTTTPLAETASDFVAQDRWHYVEIEVNNDTCSVYCDQVLALTYDVSSYTDRYFGIRQYGNQPESYTDYIRVKEYTSINRKYVDLSNTGSTNQGTYAQPFNTKNAYEYYVDNDSTAGDRICFKAGENHQGGNSIVAFVSPTDISFFPYGPASTTEHAEFNALEDETGWTGPDLNDEYYIACPNHMITVLEDVGTTGTWTRMDGAFQLNQVNTYNQAAGIGTGNTVQYREDGVSPVVPIVGALEAGQWNWTSASGGRIYMKPTGTYASNAYKIHTVGSKYTTVTWFNPTNVEVYGLWAYGNPGGGQLRQANGGDNFFIWNCIASHGFKGLLLGEGADAGSGGTTKQAHQNGKVYKCESYYCSWKGVSTEGPASNKGFQNGLWVLNYNHDIGEYASMLGDVEAIMLTPWSNYNKVYLNSAINIGSGKKTWDKITSRIHPAGILLDGPTDIEMAYNYCYNIRAGIQVQAAERGDVDNISIHDNLLVNCGTSNADYADGLHDGRPNAGVFLIARRRPTDTGVYANISNVTVVNNTFTDCDFGEYNYHHGILTCTTLQSTASAGCIIDGVTFKYNVIDDDDSTQRIFYFDHNDSDNEEVRNFVSDNNLYGMDTTGTGNLATNPVRNFRSGGTDDFTFTNMNVGTTGWTYKANAADGGTVCDAASSDGNPVLNNTTFKPETGSAAINLGDDTAHPSGLDFYLKTREYNCAGAIDSDVAS